MELACAVGLKETTTYEEHSSGLEEQPEVVRLPVRKRGFFDHAAISHAVGEVLGEITQNLESDLQEEQMEHEIQGYVPEEEERRKRSP